MTATRIVRGATLAAAAATWGLLAWLLWRTTVPPNLRLPHLDERAVFGPGLVRDARRFERFLDWEWVIATVAALTVYTVVARRGRRLAPKLGLGPVNGGIVLGVLTLTAVWAVGVPFALVANWWERRHGISRESYGSVLVGAYGRLLGTTLVALVALAVVLGLARRFRQTWWLPAAFALAATVFVLQLATPYAATIGTHSAPGPVREDARALDGREHAGKPPIRVENVSGRTNAENAFAIGIGPSERVIVWNTLLAAPRQQVRFVLGHELAHLARNHVLRGVGWFALLALPVLLVVSRVTDLRRAAAVPVALLVVALAQIALLPVQDAIARRYEAEADWIGLNGSRDPAAARGLFVRFVRSSLQDPSPPGWVHVLLDDHPTPLQRVEMAQAWRTRRR